MSAIHVIHTLARVFVTSSLTLHTHTSEPQDHAEHLNANLNRISTRSVWLSRSRACCARSPPHELSVRALCTCVSEYAMCLASHRMMQFVQHTTHAHTTHRNARKYYKITAYKCKYNCTCTPVESRERQTRVQQIARFHEKCVCVCISMLV